MTRDLVDEMFTESATPGEFEAMLDEAGIPFVGPKDADDAWHRFKDKYPLECRARLSAMPGYPDAAWLVCVEP
jgi:hypothetical protein